MTPRSGSRGRRGVRGRRREWWTGLSSGWGLLVLLVAPATFFGVGDGQALELGPESDWCRAIDGLATGEELVLQPGEYRGPCTIRRGGSPGSPLTIRAKDPENAPRIVYPERESNVLHVRANHVVLRGLQFGPTLPDVDAIRIYSSSDVTVEECRFQELGGIAVVANNSSIRKLTVRRNEILRSNATAMYIGCHDGASCSASEVVIEQNYIHAVKSTAVGYGIQVKLNSTATIRDNVIVDTKGPGIMVYGFRDLTGLSVIERNFVARSKQSSAIVIGGGPAIVRNNVAIGSAEAGIGLENYGNRGLLRGIVLVHNTVYGNDAGGIVAPPEGRLEATVVNNAVQARAGTAAFPVGRVGVLSLGNADCSWIACFADPGSWNFSPLASGPGAPLTGPWLPVDDYFGRARGLLPTVGAIDGPAGPIGLGIKSRSR